MPEVVLPEDFFTLIEGKGSLCAVAYCRRRRVKGRRICHKCRMVKWRAANPMRSAYCTLRDHAKARKLSFTISFDQYRELCSTTGYLDKKGNKVGCLHLDRIDPTLGYDYDNIQVLSCSENTAKGNQERTGEAYQRQILIRKGYLPEDDDWVDPDSVSYQQPNGDQPF